MTKKDLLKNIEANCLILCLEPDKFPQVMKNIEVDMARFFMEFANEFRKCFEQASGDFL